VAVFVSGSGFWLLHFPRREQQNRTGGGRSGEYRKMNLFKKKPDAKGKMLKRNLNHKTLLSLSLSLSLSLAAVCSSFPEAPRTFSMSTIFS
jgi:hypothetical protein